MGEAGDTSPKRVNGVGERIRTVRGAQSREAFSDALGIHANTLARYENEERAPDADFLQKICETFTDVDPAWLLTGSHRHDRIDRVLLEAVLEAVEEHLGRERLELLPAKKAHLTSTLYELFADKDSQVDATTVGKLIRLIA